jgi:hypothetical protein
MPEIKPYQVVYLVSRGWHSSTVSLVGKNRLCPSHLIAEELSLVLHSIYEIVEILRFVMSDK